MAFLGTNVIELQQGPDHETPIFLIHDAGGTVLKYVSLGTLGRNVYGIQDPKIESEDGWNGGLKSMAFEYIELIRTIKRTGPVFLGGWSLGGLVSLQIARFLDDEHERSGASQGAPRLFVAGVVLIDSPYTVPWRENRDRFVDFNPQFPTWTSDRVRRTITRRFEVCDELIYGWHPPLWTNDICHNGEMETAPALEITPNVPQGPSFMATKGGSESRSTGLSPRIVMLKATEHVPFTEPVIKSNALHNVDLFRNDLHLGWRLHAENWLDAVHEIPGNHFDLFDQEDRACVTPLH